MISEPAQAALDHLLSRALLSGIGTADNAAIEVGVVDTALHFPETHVVALTISS